MRSYRLSSWQAWPSSVRLRWMGVLSSRPWCRTAPSGPDNKRWRPVYNRRFDPERKREPYLLQVHDISVGSTLQRYLGPGIRRGIHTVDDIQEATSKAILGGGMLEAGLLPESLQIADPRPCT